MALDNSDIRLINVWREIADSWIARGNYINRVCQQAVEHGSTRGMEEMPEYAFNAGNFNANFGGGGQSLPVGMHPVVIKKTEMKLTKDQTGGMIACTLLAIDGPAKDGTQILNLNVKNNSAEAVRIANEQLAAICAVTGQPGLVMTNTEQLHDKPFVIEVVQQKNDPRYVEVNAVFTMNGLTAAEVLAGAGGAGGGAAADPNAGAFGGGAAKAADPNAGAFGGGTATGGTTGGGQAWGGGAGAGAGAGGGKPGWGG